MKTKSSLSIFLLWGIHLMLSTSGWAQVASSTIETLRTKGFNLRYTDSATSFYLQHKALEMARRLNKDEEISNSYTTLFLTYLTFQKIVTFSKYVDSVNYLAANSSNKRIIANSNLGSGLRHNALGQPVEALENYQEAYKLFHQLKDYNNESKTAVDMARLLSGKDLNQWEPYAKLALEAAKLSNNVDATLLARLLYGRVLYEKAKLDKKANLQSLFNYHQSTIQLAEEKSDSIYSKANIALAYFTLAGLYLEIQSHYNELLFLKNLDSAIVLAEQYRVLPVYRNALGMKGTYFLQNKNYTEAEKLFNQGILLQKSNERQDANTLAIFYNSLKDLSKIQGNYKAYLDYDTAFQYYNQQLYNETQEQKLQNANVKFDVERKEATIASLEKENGLHRKNKQLGFGIATLFGIGLLLMFGIYNFRRKYFEKSKEVFMEKQKIAELKLNIQRQETTTAWTQKLTAERKLLQSQMDPHFVFNALGNIQSFVLQNDKANAMSYLSTFSKLMRQILMQSKKDSISLLEETESLKNYLLLQQLRLNYSFDYEVIIEQGTDSSFTIPPMLIQPFVENAVEHGLRPLPENDKGKLTVSFSTHPSKHIVLCTIQDNGVGIEQSQNKKEHKNAEENHQSMSTNITKQRIEQMITATRDSEISITSLQDEGGKIIGTQVVLTIPLND